MVEGMIDYEKYAKKHIYYGNENIDDFLEKIINIKIKSNKNSSLLDIGAGSGNIISRLKEIFPTLLISVSDISKIRIERIKILMREKINKYYIDDICNSKIPSDSYDIINSDQVIEHVMLDITMIKEIKRILKDKGLFRVSSVYKKKGAWYFHKNNNERLIDPTHLREYTSIENFKKIFTNQSLKIIDIKTEPIKYPILDPFLTIMKIKSKSKFINKLRGLKIKIPKYYRITIVGEKNDF
ncbi:class I SAM-dependent methyltransferase [Candidatus Pacearchaeota archaeon]|nr:class I SAM-dependent methyltransferase [Candidatus Pacearchaeota archaeon]